MEEIQVYYFNNGNRKWVPVMADSMAVDINSGMTYKFIPPQPEISIWRVLSAHRPCLKLAPAFWIEWGKATM